MGLLGRHIFRHFSNGENDGALKMIIPSTAGIGKYSLIGCISHALCSSKTNGNSPLLLLAPTGIGSFKKHEKTIHYALKNPIKYMKPLCG